MTMSREKDVHVLRGGVSEQRMTEKEAGGGCLVCSQESKVVRGERE